MRAPQELKDGYAYNPKEAKKLLADAVIPAVLRLTLSLTPQPTWIYLT